MFDILLNTHFIDDCKRSIMKNYKNKVINKPYFFPTHSNLSFDTTFPLRLFSYSQHENQISNFHSLALRWESFYNQNITYNFILLFLKTHVIWLFRGGRNWYQVHSRIVKVNRFLSRFFESKLGFLDPNNKKSIQLGQAISLLKFSGESPATQKKILENLKLMGNLVVI